MKYFCLALFFSLSLQLSKLNGQTKNSLNLPHKLSHSQEKIDLPIQLGIEVGVPPKIFGKNFFTSGIFGYININLSKRNVFLKIEYGNLWLNNELEDKTSSLRCI